MGTQTYDFTEDQQAALAWLAELARLTRIANAAIYMGRYDPVAWDDAQRHMDQIKATAAAGPKTPERTS